MENDLISRAAAKSKKVYCLERHELIVPVAELDWLPAVDAAPVVHGRNISKQNPVDEFICSECGLVCRDICRYEYDEDAEDWSCLEWTFSYCPRCGAKIDGEAPNDA